MTADTLSDICIVLACSVTAFGMAAGGLMDGRHPGPAPPEPIRTFCALCNEPLATHDIYCDNCGWKVTGPRDPLP